MPHRFVVSLASLPALLLAAVTAAAAPPSHPFVAGFERFHAGHPDAAGGALLLQELNCVSCHQPADAKVMTARPAPVLDGVGSRVRLGHLRRFLADPQAVKPGTTMPHLFAGDPDRNRKVEALVHFLATTGTPRHERLDLKGIAPGRALYHSVGCVACHGPRDAAGDSQPVDATVVPLGDLKSKYTVASLTAFLDNPHQARPGGRMPKILSGKEAKDVACYLLQGMKGDPGATVGATTFAYYEGSWDNLPDFRSLKPKATGIGAAFDLGAARRKNDYAMVFQGVFKAERDGEYRFQLGSDDGSRLEIDGKTVVDNDGVHAMRWHQGAVKLTKGAHKVTVAFFQVGGGDELEVRIEGPGLPLQELAGLVAPNEAALEKRATAPKKDDEDRVEIQPALVAEGRALFASVGCARCHTLHIDGKPVTPTLSAPPLAALRGDNGCLAPAPAVGQPRYALSTAQRTALVAALKAPPAPPATPAETVARTLTTFNCYACHSRGKVGGPEEALNASFQTTQPEMGDEGRVPPPLDGVGAKLNPSYFRQVLDRGADDRPYMLARMPGFGAANVGHLVGAFEAIDHLPTVPPVKFAVLPTQMKAAARQLVGGNAFGCIKCHTFAGHRAEGVQGIDMVLMPRRLRRDWFHAYVADPQRVRPGTRMPAGFEKGKSVLPKVLDGTALTQIEAMWQYLSDAPSVRLPEGLRKQSIPIIPDKTAIIYRNFVEGAGTRAIAVGYPEKVHLAFDANELRLALLWQGAFIDAARHWTDRGSGWEGPLGDNLLTLARGPDFAVLAKADEAWPTGPAKAPGQRFLGYRLTAEDRPTFLYTVGPAHVEDFAAPSAGAEASLKRTLTLTAPSAVDGLTFRAAAGKTIEAAGDGWFRLDGAWKLRVEGATTPTVRSTGGKAELRVPVRFVDGKARLVVEYRW